MELITDYVNYPPKKSYLTFSYGDIVTHIYEHNGDYWVVEYYSYDDWDEMTNPEGGFVYGTMIVNLRTMARTDLYYEDLDAEDIEKVMSDVMSDDWYLPRGEIDKYEKEIQEFYLTYIKENYEDK